MVRGREETSTSGRLGGWPRAKPSASNIIASLTMEELKVYCKVPDNIDLRLMEGADESTLGGEHNGVFFTREHLAVGLRFPVPAIVKQFLHFTRAPLALIQRDSHPNWMLRAEPFVPTGSHVGGAFYHLLPKHRVGRPDVHVSFESSTANCEWAPRLAEDRGERGVTSEGSLG